MKRKESLGLFSGVLKKMPLSGVGEIRVPSDIRRVLVSNIEKLRENSLEIFANEISKVLAKVDFQRIIDDVLKNYTLRVEASIDLVPKNRKKQKKS